MIHGFIAFSVLLSCFFDLAFANEKVAKIFFYSKEGSIGSTNFSELRVNAEHAFSHPHVVMDPTKKPHKYGGVDVEKLLRSHFLSVADSDIITFISADTYVASLSFLDLKKSKAFFALERDGKVASWKQGVPGLNFPPIPIAQEYQTDPSWWSWWVSAVVQGEPKLNLKWSDSDLDFAACKEKHVRIAPYPRGRRSFKDWKDKKAELTYCSLQKLKQNSKIVSITNMVGKKQEIPEKSGEFFVVHAVNGQPIPVSMGGPYHVCKKIDADECMYFVSKIEAKDAKAK